MGLRPRLPAAAAPRLNGSPGRSPGDYQLLTSVAPALSGGSFEGKTIRNRPIPLRPWYPVTVHLNALVALRGFLFFFCLCSFVSGKRGPRPPRRGGSFEGEETGLFQASVAPALPCRSSESETIRNRPIPLRPWYPVAVNLNALVALRRSSWPFVDHSFSFVFFRLFQTRDTASGEFQGMRATGVYTAPEG